MEGASDHGCRLEIQHPDVVLDQRRQHRPTQRVMRPCDVLETKQNVSVNVTKKREHFTNTETTILFLKWSSFLKTFKMKSAPDATDLDQAFRG